MARYIDADALLDSLMGYKKYISIQFGELEMLGCDVVKQCIDSAPTADVMERKRGEWVDKDGVPIDHELEMMEEAFCNQCGNSALGYPFWDCDLELSNFCPNCGADMRGKENGEHD